MKFTVRETIDCDPASFWALFATDDYVHATAAASESTAGVSAQDGAPPDAFSRTVRLTSPVDAPGPVRKLVGDTQTVTDSGQYDPAAGTWTYTITPDTLSDKIRISGVIRLEDVGDGTVVKVNDLDVTVKIFGLGGLFEKSIEGQTRKSEKTIAETMNRLLEERA